MEHYVVGFLFNESMDRVVLIAKDHPEWQDGKLNGVGGKIRDHETADAAMTREFYEEAGVLRKDWILFCRINGRWGTLHCFYARGDVAEARTMEVEQVSVWLVSDVVIGDPSLVIPNTPWLLAMARSLSLGEHASGFRVEEV